MEISVMPFLMALEAGRLRRVYMQRDLVLAHRQDAARVQNLGTVARNFLRFVVVQGAQQPRGGHQPRIGAEQTGNIRPYFQPHRRKLGGEVSSGGVGTAASQQHRVAVVVGGDETLRYHHPIERSPMTLHALIRCEITRG